MVSQNNTEKSVEIPIDNNLEEVDQSLSTDHDITDEFPDLAAINDEFTRLYRDSLSSYFGKRLDMFVESIKVQKYEDVLWQTIQPSMFCAVSMKPLRGNSMISFPPGLVFSLIDLTFGGTDQLRVKAEGRAFTPFEVQAMKEVMVLLLNDMKTAWDPVYRLQPVFLRIETSPQLNYARISPLEEVVVTTYAVDGGHYHEFFNLCLPVGMLAPIEGILRQNSNPFPSRTEDLAFTQAVDDLTEPMEILKSWDARTMAHNICNEHPQTVAYILVMLDDAEKAGDVLSNLPPNYRADVSYRIAIMGTVRKNAKQIILNGVADITQRFSRSQFVKMGGTEVCYDILHHAGEELLEDVLSTIKQVNPDLTNQLLDEGKIYSMVSTEMSKSLQSDQKIDLETARDLVRSRQKMQAMQTVFDDVIKLLREGGKELINGLENIDQSMEESFSSLNEEQLENLFRETLVDAMVLAVDYWLQTSGKDKVELAEESKIWTVYLDKGAYQTRTLDKYLSLSKLPQNPRWKDVVQTVQFVLEAGPESQPLKPKLQSLLSQLHALMRVKQKQTDN